MDSSYHWTSVGIGWFIKPRVFVNGHPVPGARWGRTHIPVGAGSYHVEVAVSSGSSSVVGIQVPVGPGAGTTVYYSASALGFAKGAIGAEPQRSPRAIPAIVLTIAALAYAVWSIGGLALNIAF
ncbi:hypothetical protein [Nocardia rhizosphaerae]|uniref:DUF4397 domain-containing protein n=1 Tax=Nocardia rhizosphaerae TaxID=1691571 RepID=A0ABV8L040_9NOCA